MVGEKLRNTALAASLSVVLPLSACTSATHGEAFPLQASDYQNKLDPRIQLDQVASYAASVIGCMIKDEKMHVKVDRNGDLSNSDFIDGPDNVGGSEDDQNVPALMTMMDYRGESLIFHVSYEQKWIHVDSESGAGKIIWDKVGFVTPDVVDEVVKDLQSNVLIVRTSDTDTEDITKVEMGEGDTAPIVNIRNDIMLADAKLATSISSDVKANIRYILKQSGVKSCDVS